MSDMDDVGTLMDTLDTLIAEEEARMTLPRTAAGNLMTVIQPPWRRMAEEQLKHRTPEEYRRLKKARKLEAHLDRVEAQAKGAYDASVRKLSALNPGHEAFIMQSVQEVVTRDILDPTT